MTRSAQGEDRSNFQAVGPWKNLDFGWCKATEGLTFTDKTFAANWANLKTQVGYRGAYHFFHPGMAPVTQAEFFMSTVIRQGLRPGDMLAIDSEIAVGENGTQLLAPGTGRRSHYFYNDDKGRTRVHRLRDYPGRMLRPTFPRKLSPVIGLGGPFVGLRARIFLNEVKELARNAVGGDYCPIFCYSYTAFLPQLSPCTDYPLWAAFFSGHAPPSVHPWDTWTIWQYAGGGGQFGADQDAFNGTRADLDAFMRAYQPGAKPRPSPQPAPNWTETLMNQLPVLQSGASGQDVRTVQALLCARGHTIAIDGNFGTATKAAVITLQSGKGLGADGIVGHATWPALLNR